MANMTRQSLISYHPQIANAPIYVNRTEKLVASTAVSVPVPDNAIAVRFARSDLTKEFYAILNDVPTISDTAVTDGTSGEVNPAMWTLVGLTGTSNTIGIISEQADHKITLSFYTGIEKGFI